MYRGPFDFNGDGEMSSFERAAEFAFLRDVMGNEESDDDHFHSVWDGDETDDEDRDEWDLSTDLTCAGLDEDELRLMDEDERREALEDAGLDPDDYEYLDD